MLDQDICNQRVFIDCQQYLLESSNAREVFAVQKAVCFFSCFDELG
jgi:hypothetical protein